jgi:hypothetical protein
MAVAVDHLLQKFSAWRTHPSNRRFSMLWIHGMSIHCQPKRSEQSQSTAPPPPEAVADGQCDGASIVFEEARRFRPEDLHVCDLSIADVPFPGEPVASDRYEEDRG